MTDDQTIAQAVVKVCFFLAGISPLVERFDQHGLAGLAIARGRGRKPT